MTAVIFASVSCTVCTEPQISEWDTDSFTPVIVVACYFMKTRLTAQIEISINTYDYVEYIGKNLWHEKFLQSIRSLGSIILIFFEYTQTSSPRGEQKKKSSAEIQSQNCLMISFCIHSGTVKQVVNGEELPVIIYQRIIGCYHSVFLIIHWFEESKL